MARLPHCSLNRQRFKASRDYGRRDGQPAHGEPANPSLRHSRTGGNPAARYAARMRSQRTRWGVGTGYVIPSEAEKSLGLDCSPAHAGVLMPAHGEPVEPPPLFPRLSVGGGRNLAPLSPSFP